MTVRGNPLVLHVAWLALLALVGGCATQFSPKDLQGTWAGQDHTVNSRGKSLTNKRLVLEVDEDGMIRGSSQWTLVDGAGGNRVDRPVATDSEEVLGAFDPQTGWFYLVETDEPGFLHGRLSSRDRLKLFLVQSGAKPVASFVEFSRDPQ